MGELEKSHHSLDHKIDARVRWGGESNWNFERWEERKRAQIFNF